MNKKILIIVASFLCFSFGGSFGYFAYQKLIPAQVSPVKDRQETKKDNESPKEEKPKVNESIVSEKESEDSYNEGVYLSSQIASLVFYFVIKIYSYMAHKNVNKVFVTLNYSSYCKGAVIIYLILIPVFFAFFMKSDKEDFLSRLFDVYDKFYLKSWKRSIVFTLLWFVFSYLLVFVFWKVVKMRAEKKISEVEAEEDGI